MRENWQSPVRLLSYVPRVLRLVWTASPAYAFLTVLVTALSALATPAQIWLIKVIIDRVAALLGTAPATGMGDWPVLALPTTALILTIIVGDVCRSVSDNLETLLGTHVATYANYLILQKAAELDLAFYETPAFFDQLNLARNAVWRAQNLARLTVRTIGFLLSTVTTLTLLSTIHPLAVIVLLVVTAPHLLLRSRYAGMFFRLLNLRTPAQRMVDYLTSLLLSQDAIKEVRIFRLQTPFLERFQEHWRSFLTESRTLLFAHEKWNIFLSVLSMVGAGAIWVYAIAQTVLNRLTLGELALAFQTVAAARNSLAELFCFGGLYYEEALFVSTFFGVLDIEPDSLEGALERTGAVAPTLCVPRPLKQGFELRNVSFRYPGTEGLVLEDISFAIAAGTAVALVGANGGGKTTLVKLLARFYDPTDGVILLDGRDLRDYDVDDLRRAIGVIFQDFVRYHLTVQENIGFGQLEYLADTGRVAAAAQKGGAAPLVARLPNGYATRLGRTFEESVDLSGGEWQKLALSRAFMREAQILILDEPTAALDALAEYDVYQRFAQLTAATTTVFISHRFSTVRMAQQIVVLDKGRLLEQGSHDELMAMGGHYAQMFSVQAERYR